ncbi:MAG TPA: hypothetical protein VJL89_05810 [Thermodesulfovibrionia bacterium]|nr:hypothetical protein [Thermodesulfovibrionia bacterium]
MVEIAEQNLKEATDERQGVTKQSDGSANLNDLKEKYGNALTARDQAVSAMASSGMPLGWKDYPKDPLGILSKVVGLLVSILAVSLGAPFWFDRLQNIMQIRASGVRHLTKKGAKQ